MEALLREIACHGHRDLRRHSLCTLIGSNCFHFVGLYCLQISQGTMGVGQYM
jgi:hypothetical protein